MIQNDTINAIYNLNGIIGTNPEKTLLDIFCSIANVIIAFVNIVLIIYIFIKNNKKDDSDKEKIRKQNLLKILVLDHNMPRYYSFFKETCDVVVDLKIPDTYSGVYPFTFSGDVRSLFVQKRLGRCKINTFS